MFELLLTLSLRGLRLVATAILRIRPELANLICRILFVSFPFNFKFIYFRN